MNEIGFNDLTIKENNIEPGKFYNKDKYFRLGYSRRYWRTYTLKSLLKQFNPDDYWIYKMTGNQRLQTTEDFKKLRYGGYIFFNKLIYDIDFIEDWLEFIYKKMNITIPYLSKPLPPRYILEKIKVIDVL